MASPLSNFANDLFERLHRIKCKLGHDDKKNVKHTELNISIAAVF